MPVPDVVAQCQIQAELVGQADLDDAVDVAQRLAEFDIGRIVQPAFEGGDDLAARQADAARTRTARMKGKPKRAR